MIEHGAAAALHRCEEGWIAAERIFRIREPSTSPPDESARRFRCPFKTRNRGARCAETEDEQDCESLAQWNESGYIVLAIIRENKSKVYHEIPPFGVCGRHPLRRKRIRADRMSGVCEYGTAPR